LLFEVKLSAWLADINPGGVAAFFRRHVMIGMRAIDSRICFRDIATLPKSGGCNGEEGQGEEVNESEEAGEKGEEVGLG
jgi:hypothetical protein